MADSKSESSIGRAKDTATQRNLPEFRRNPACLASRVTFLTVGLLKLNFQASLNKSGEWCKQVIRHFDSIWFNRRDFLAAIVQ
jgi:hypothetical protein